MVKFELKLPKMGEIVAEATITAWLKDIDDTIEEDEAVLENATDKVDSEVPSEVGGILIEKRFDVDVIVQVGQTIAIIKLEGEAEAEKENSQQPKEIIEDILTHIKEDVVALTQNLTNAEATVALVISSIERFYSPLVKNIAKQEGISQAELDTIPGTGKEGRVTKNNIKLYIKSRNSEPNAKPIIQIKECQSQEITNHYTC